MKMKKHYNVDDAIDFIFGGNQSDLSGLSSDQEENDKIEDALQNKVSDDESPDAAESDNDIRLASLAGVSNQVSSNDQGQANNGPAQRVYRWRKRDTLLEKFSEPPLEDMAHLQYFSMFITTALLDIVVEPANIYSFQIFHKSIETNRAEIMYMIGMSIKMGILQLLSYKSYWNRGLCCPRIADVMPPNRCQELVRYLNFVNHDNIND